MLTYITTPSQFIGELNVPINSCTSDKLQYYIEEHEPEMLRHILGGKFYSMLQTELLSTLAGDWEILVNGGEYTFDGYSLHFKGLRAITAKLIYFYIQRDLAVQSTANGGVSIKSEAGTKESLEGKVIYNWNNAVSLIGRNFCNQDKEGTLKHFLNNSTLTDYSVKNYSLTW